MFAAAAAAAVYVKLMNLLDVSLPLVSLCVTLIDCPAFSWSCAVHFVVAISLLY